MPNLLNLILIAPPILLALTFHEVAHGWVAYKFGDPTAKMAGRLTLNPIPHLDPIGTILLFIVHFGWAKPVPVNPAYFRNPKRDLMWVSLAGPASNLLLALVFGLIFRLLLSGGLMIGGEVAYVLVIMLKYAVLINIVLAVFNLIPIPPLDGSKILFGLLPRELERHYLEFERYGPMLIIGLVFVSFVFHVSIIWPVLSPFVDFFYKLFTGAHFGGF
jgi:Zn-dependent protease